MKKIFISHKDVDSKQAILIKKEFQKYNIDAYLDVLDSNIIDDGEILTKHIRKQLLYRYNCSYFKRNKKIMVGAF